MWWRKKRTLEDFQEEIRSHLALEADEIRERGESADEEGAARRAFGNVAATEERWYEHRRWLVFDSLSREVRQALRRMKTRPGLCLVVILTLALGIGANSAVFSIVEAVLLRPLPYQDPGRLGMLFGGDPARELHEGRVSLLNFADWRSQNHSFADMTMYIGQTFLLGTKGAPERMRSARVEARFWPLVGVEPRLGRTFTAEEERRGERVVVLSYALWQQQFGGAREVLGSHLTMDDRSYEVIGVMPPDFQFPFRDTKVWEPVTAHPYWTTRDRRATRSGAAWLALGRLKPGITWASAQDEMNAIARRLSSRDTADEAPPSIAVVPLEVQTTGRFRLSLWLLLGSVFTMLLIACTNVAGLLLAHGSVREREFAVRRALGAGQLRIAGQVLTETVVLAAFGGLLGLLLAWGGAAMVRAFGPTDIPRLAEARADWPVIGFTAAATLFAALLASVWPALASGKARVGSRQWTSASTRRAGDLLVIGQFALALMLVTSATLLIHSFLRLRAVELGFRPEHLLVMRVDLHIGRTSEQQAAYFEEAIRRAEAIPGVHSAAAVTGFLRTDPEDAVQIEGREVQHPGPCQDFVAGAYFETAGIALQRGREFSEEDRRGTLPVAIVNETMARTHWPGSDAIGKRFRFRDSAPWLTVVGVTGDARRQGLDRAIAPQVFLPHRQGTENMMDILVRTDLAPAAMAGIVQQEIQGLDNSVAKFNVTTVTQELSRETGERRFDTLLVSTFAFVALFLSAIGIYGLLHHAVVQRTNEIGVRVALGAGPQAVTMMVLRRGLTLAVVGAIFGLGGAYGSSRLLSSMLFQVAPTDPLTFGVAVAVLMAVAGVACWAPARHAARIDPMVALRRE